MIREHFDHEYREARMTLKVMASRPNEKVRGQYVTSEQRAEAEQRWVQRVHTPAYQAVVNSLHMGTSLAQSAVFDYRYCGGLRKAWYLDLARK